VLPASSTAVGRPTIIERSYVLPLNFLSFSLSRITDGRALRALQYLALFVFYIV